MGEAPKLCNGCNFCNWWKPDWLLSGRRVAIADIGQLPAFPKRIARGKWVMGAR